MASWYGDEFDGRPTASGEIYDMYALTAAHRTLPFGTVLEVKSRDSGRSVRVRINDRGPFKKNRLIDLSYAAARELDMIGPGTASVEISPVLLPTLHGLRWTLQVGAFHDLERADELAATLCQRFSGVAVRSSGAWHRVQVGEFERRDEADPMRAELAARGLDPLLVEIW